MKRRPKHAPLENGPPWPDADAIVPIKVWLIGIRGITTLAPLEGHEKLRNLTIDDADNLVSLEPLKGLRDLEHLEIEKDRGVVSVTP
jgi:hypothetical protein